MSEQWDGWSWERVAEWYILIFGIWVPMAWACFLAFLLVYGIVTGHFPWDMP